MRKLIIAVVAVACAAAVTLQAQDAAPKKQKKELTAEQKQVMTDMLAKYDTNKDGKLDKTEKAAMTPQDKEAWAKAFPAKKKEGAGTKETPKADATK